ncbi:MAG: DMT family transporter [Tannerellaceae bacterium]|jgi:drug/metabolite transporter (DMT)-like permease|nr:DMT family transporter [Tannerellaceae bacterium]
MMTSEKWKGHGLILLVNILFAVNLPISKYLIPSHVSPEALTLMRSVFACAMFWLTSMFVGRERMELKDMGLLFVCALCGVTLNTALFMTGLNLTSPVDASIISTAGPIYVMLLAALILKEPITWMKAAGVALGVCGALLMILTAAGGGGGGEDGIGGVIRIALSNLLYSIYVVLSRPLSRKYSAITIMKWMFLFSTLMLFPFMYKGVLEAPVFAEGLRHPADLGALLYVLLFATFITYALIPMSLRRLRPTTVSMYNYIQPIVASLIAMMIGQGSFTGWKLLSTILVFAGVYMVTQSKSREDVEKERGKLIEEHQQQKSI